MTTPITVKQLFQTSSAKWSDYPAHENVTTLELEQVKEKRLWLPPDFNGLAWSSTAELKLELREQTIVTQLTPPPGFNS